MLLPRFHSHSFAASGEALPALAASPHGVGGTTIATRRRRPLRVRNAKRANLSASRTESVKVPTYEDAVLGRSYRISEFLSHPSGVEAMLNARVMQSYQLIDSTTYRCELPTINILDFEATPVLDLRLTSSSEGCKVEMLSCKLNGSEVVERQNDHYKAYMTNHIRWRTNDHEEFLEINVELSLVLEIFSQPFVMLPTSAVEVPGNVAMQAVVDRLVQLLLKHLLEDYQQWVHRQSGNLNK
ncbi:hypothetical protein MLD38_016277 [Melastoma candidum]|uniref:Uncharacterized protein n=1 Tax=Melastoma candidum TaxID=119954 RepID=A0ACB9RIR2_9MYRT|nr:hypothetical protein MLD38_016277 [Melastoma candidum]